MMVPSLETTPQPSELICEVCETRPAVTGDGPTLRCMVCIMQMADWAIRPELVDQELAKDLTIVHGDLVELVTEQPGEVYMTPFGRFFNASGEPRVVWRFDEEAFVPNKRPPYAALNEDEWSEAVIEPYSDLTTF